MQALFTPGHSKGSTSYYYKQEKAIFTGDAVLLPGEIPIFDDINAYFNSLEKIKNINPQQLYSAWDKPRFKHEIPEILEQSKIYIKHIQNITQKVAVLFKREKSMEFCKAILIELGQNENLANPLLLKSFLACLK